MIPIGWKDLWSCWQPRYSVPIGWEDLWSYWLPKICDSHCWKDLWSCWLPRYDVPIVWRTCDHIGRQGTRFPWAEICDLADCQDILFPLAGKTCTPFAKKVCDLAVKILYDVPFLWSFWLARYAVPIGWEVLWSYWPPRYAIPVRSEDLWSFWLPRYAFPISEEGLWSSWLRRYANPFRSDHLWSCLIAKKHMLFPLAEKACDLIGYEGGSSQLKKGCVPSLRR